MKICIIPIDNRPVCYSLIKDICAIDANLEIFIPPKVLLGDLKKSANTDELLEWLKFVPDTDIAIISLDTLVYGGLVLSRRSSESLENIKNRLSELKSVLKNKKSKIYAFSSIMRISNNNYNEEEKIYWKDYGKKIFEYSYNVHKYGLSENYYIPDEILEDYINTRKRNFEINKIYLEWQKEGIFDTLIFSKDDCAEYGYNVMEAMKLEKLGGVTRTGADEIPLTLLARGIKKNINIYVSYTEPDYTSKISNYEDISIEKSVLGQLELGGFRVVQNEKDADIILVVNNFIEKQGELVMGWDTKPFNKSVILPEKPYAVADVRYANGADDIFVKDLLQKMDLNKFYGYSGWNTSANTLGTILATIKVKWMAENYNHNAFKHLQAIRFLDDWAYQANIRGKIVEPCDITEFMRPYENELSFVLDYKIQPKYNYPWNRKFEIEVIV